MIYFPYSQAKVLNIYRDIFPVPVVTPAHPAQELWDNPLPTPEWITQVATIYDDLSGFDALLDDYPLCIKVYLDAIWDWDAEDTNPKGVVSRTIGITVDRTTIAYRDIDIWYIGLVALGCDVQYPWERFRETAGVTDGGIRIAPGIVDFLIIRSGSAPGYDNIDDDCHILEAPNYICFNTPPLAPGLHTATIRIENNAGVPYTYEWAFLVEEGG